MASISAAVKLLDIFHSLHDDGAVRDQRRDRAQRRHHGQEQREVLRFYSIVRTTLPTFCPVSTYLCASAACSSG
jgi:hypothetical protein